MAVKQWLVDNVPLARDDIFVDVDPVSGLRPGVRWKDALRQANSRCEAVICLVSRNWDASHECKVEYRTAEMLGKQIFVARLEPSAGDELTSEWQRCDLFSDGKSIEISVDDGDPVTFNAEGLRRLRDGIRAAGIGADNFVWPPPEDPDRSPYRGWEPLTEQDTAVYFGRDAQILSALDEIRGMRLSGVRSLFVVLGPSGTGKSSFLRAGLLPRLRREDRRFVVAEPVRPERDALTGSRGLAQAIVATRARLGLSTPALGEVKSACRAAEVDRIADWLQEIRAAAADKMMSGDDSADAPTLVLPLDQAEELFTADGAVPAPQFLALLDAVLRRLNDAGCGMLVVATIRTDLFELLQSQPEFAEKTVVFDELKPMPPTQFAEVITGPARRASRSGHSLRLDPHLVQRLLADSAGGADALPMLALTMSRLYSDYGSSGELTVAQYEAMGGMSRVVQTEIDDVLTLDPEQRATNLELLHRAFIPWLATVSPLTDQAIRRVARYQDLPTESHGLIDALVAKRLLVKDVRDGETVVEVALESLLRQWDALAEWLREERQNLTIADDIERTASAWSNNAEDPSWLLAGSRLIDAETLAATPGFQQRLRPAAEFLAASRAAENDRAAAEEQYRQAELATARERQETAEAHAAVLRKRSRVLRMVVALTTVAALLAATGLVWATVASRDAKRQFKASTSQRLVAEAAAALAGNTPGSDLRMLQGLTVASALGGAEMTDALADAGIQKSNLHTIFHVRPYGDDVYYNMSSHMPDQMLAVFDETGTATFIDQATRDVVTHPEPLPGSNGEHPTATVFSADSSTLAAGYSDGTIELWDPHTATPRTERMIMHKGPVTSIAFSHDGGLLASGGADGHVQLWDLESTRTRWSRRSGAKIVRLGFTADDSKVIVSDDHARMTAWATYGTDIEPVDMGVGRATVSKDGSWAAVENLDGSIALWDLKTMKPTGPGVQAGTENRDVRIAIDSAKLAFRQASTGEQPTTIESWDLMTGKPLGPPIELPSSGDGKWDLSPSGRTVAVSGNDGQLRFWATDTGAPLGAPTPTTPPIFMGFSDDGTRLRTIDHERVLRIFDMTTFTFDMLGFGETFSAGGSWLVSTWAGKNYLISRDPYTGALQKIGDRTEIPLSELHLKRGEPLRAFDHLLALADGERVAVLDLNTGRQIGKAMTVDTDGIRIAFLAFSGNGDRIAAGTRSGVVEVFETDSGKRVGRWRSTGEHRTDPRNQLRGVGLNDDGHTIAVIDGENRYLIDTDTSKQLSETRINLGAPFASVLATDIQGARLAVSTFGGTLRFYDGLFQEELEAIGAASDTTAGGSAGAVALTPDGRWAVSAHWDGTLRLWDGTAGRAVGSPVPITPDHITRVAISPDGSAVSAGGYSLGQVGRLPPPLPDNNTTLVSSMLRVRTSVEDICAKLVTNMSRKEWNEWVSPDLDYVKGCPDLPIAPD